MSRWFPSTCLSVSISALRSDDCNIHLADELAAKCVDDTSNGGGGALADEVKVKHALDSSGLHAAVVPPQSAPASHATTGHHLLYETSCLIVEECVLEGGQGTAWGRKTANVVVC